VPELLLLDEPLAGLDHAGTAQFYEIVSGLRRFLDLSILLVSHDLNAAASIADRMVFINKRSLLYDGTPAEVLHQPEVRKAFGLDVRAGSPDLSATALCPTNGGGAL
jgi:ABC-type Mn2+/Zn2+ transport system ATPase subunit